MENPHEQQQNALLGRIVLNISKLNAAVSELNERIEELNKNNNDIVQIARMWSSYNGSSGIHLENTKSLSDPK